MDVLEANSIRAPAGSWAKRVASSAGVTAGEPSIVKVVPSGMIAVRPETARVFGVDATLMPVRPPTTDSYIWSFV